MRVFYASRTEGYDIAEGLSKYHLNSNSYNKKVFSRKMLLIFPEIS